MNRIKLAGRTTVQALVCMLLIVAFAAVANAQTFQTVNTTVTLFGGSLDTTTFGFSALTSPFPGIILTGTAISTITGKPVRHLWYGDPLNGFCRIDPEVDAPLQPVAGIGPFNPNIPTCLASVQAAGLTPGQVAFDPTNNLLYLVNTGKTGAGALRIHYIPSGDGGQGSVDIIHVDSLIGTQNTRNSLGGCPQLKDPKTGAPVPDVPSAAALDPEGNLYVGSIRDGAIVRIMGAATFNTNTDCLPAGNTGQDPTKKLQIPIASADEKFGSGHTFGLGWIGHDLFGGDNIAPWIKVNADQCLTPINGNTACANPMFGGAALPSEILAAQVQPQGGVISDAQYPTFPGAVVYFASISNIVRVTNVISATSMTVNLSYGGTFAGISGMAADPQDLNNATVFVGDDPTGGGINGSGRIWKVTAVAPAPAAPATPTVLSAVAGPGTGQATVSWAPTINGQPITSYQVKTLLASGAASGVATVTVLAPATTATISGLTVGTSYVFEVAACNTIGCSAFSAPSAVVTAFAVTVPPTPTSVTGVDAGTGNSAVVAWVQSSNGNSTITSSTISSFDSLAPNTLVSTATVLGTSTGGTIAGLTCGHSYLFSVVATNAIGSSLPSAKSAATPIACQTNADLAVTMSAPATINAGSVLTYTITVSNGGPATASSVGLTDALPAPLSSLPTSTAGACGGTVGLTSLTCNLGNMAPGSSATVTVSVLLAAGQTSPVVNTAKVTSLTADPILTNNSATASTTISSGVTGCTASTTDIQVGGSAQNGGPALGSSDTYTWQIKNNLGTVTANCVVFTQSLPATFTFFSATPSSGTCATPAVGSLGGTITCNIPSIAGGGQALITVNVGVGSVAGTFSSTGSATFTGTDTQTANNQFTVNVQPH